MTLSVDIKKYVTGQKIASFHLNRFYDDTGEWHFRPIIKLANGVEITFSVQEGYGYGVEPVLTLPQEE